MSEEKITDRKDSDLFRVETFFEEFQQELADKGSVNLLEWAAEVPNEMRDDVIPRLLTNYVRFCQQQGWTLYLADFVNRFPQYQALLDRLNEGSVVDSQDTVYLTPLSASTQYAVADRPWIEGGQGVLHKASDQGIGGRQVIVKFLKDASQADDFQKEIEITAKLEHPGVVAVFARGVEDTDAKRPFYAMRLIHGQPLEQRIAEFHNQRQTGRAWPRSAFDLDYRRRLGPLLENIISACNTVAYAHSVGVLHCDLKPKNILCGRFGATIVVDWGSARSYDLPEDRVSESTPPLKLSGDTAGSYTLGYASPEQLVGKNLTPGSDVFCLGATLYQTLTGRAPFDHHRRCDSTFKNPREIDRRIPRKLAAICNKALQPDPENRYESVDRFAKDLTNWLRDDEVVAAPDRFVERAFRVARHHKQATAIGLVAVFALTILSLVTWNLRARESQISHSLDSALTLIEGLCQPLENDQVENSAEFDRRAAQVEQFAKDYIQENRSDVKLARAHELFGLVEFYRHNRTVLQESTAHLAAAIEALEAAEQIYRSTGSDVSLAQNQVRQARWLRKLAGMEAQGRDKNLAAFGKLEEAIGQLDNRTIPLAKDQAAQRVLAEAYQIKGEFLLANRSALVLGSQGTIARLEEGQPARIVQANLRNSIASFTSAINILRNYDPSRDLARGYGFRGDAHKSLGDYAQAFQDYRSSLAIRQAEWAADSSDENSFQLARGLANFGVWMRDSAEDADFQLLLQGVLDDHQLLSAPVEIHICDAYVQKALEHQHVLAFDRGARGDDRPRVDYRWTSNVAAELYFFAAHRPGVSAEDQQRYLRQAEQYADQAIGDRLESTEPVDALPANVRNIMANSYMIKLQIAHITAADPQTIETLADRVDDLIDVHGTGYKKLGDDALLTHRIALAATDKTRDLEDVVTEMSQRGFGRNPRMKRHLNRFRGESVRAVLKAIVEAKSS